VRVLDLYAGLGGTDKGIRKVAAEKNIKLDYYAIEIDPAVCQAHKKNHLESNVICADVKDWLDKVTDFDFVWASPPCQTHSINNYSNKAIGYKTKPVDWSLWHVIDILQRAETIPFVVENVKIWYNEPFKHNFKLDRHYFWTNLQLVPFDYHKKPAKEWCHISVKDWQEYHQLEPATTGDKRQQLRNCVHWSIAAGIFEQFLEPRSPILEFFTGAEQKA